MKRTITLVAALLCLGLAVPGIFSQQPTNPPKQNFQAAKSPVSQDVPAELQSAKAKLESARNDLIHAGGEWGGFRDAAIKNIDEAQANLRKATEFYQKNVKK